MWYPANTIERELAWALSGSNYARYFRAVMRADLYVPHRTPTPRVRLVAWVLRVMRADLSVPHRAGSGSDPREWDPVPYEAFNRTFLPVFTSAERMAVLGEGVAAAVVTSFAHLRAGWPAPDWWLAINPGSPIEAYLPVAAVERAARGELLPGFDPDILIRRLGDTKWVPWPPGGANQALLDAVSRGDGEEYLDALCACQVTVPTTREVSEGELYELVRRSLAKLPHRLAEPPDRAFPWRPAGSAREPTIEVFTTAELCAAAYPGLPSATVKLQALLRLLPAGHALSVNPGGPAGLDLPSGQLPLLFQWERGAGVPRPVLLGMRWAREAPIRITEL